MGRCSCRVRPNLARSHTRRIFHDQALQAAPSPARLLIESKSASPLLECSMQTVGSDSALDFHTWLASSRACKAVLKWSEGSRLKGGDESVAALSVGLAGKRSQRLDDLGKSRYRSKLYTVVSTGDRRTLYRSNCGMIHSRGVWSSRRVEMIRHRVLGILARSPWYSIFMELHESRARIMSGQEIQSRCLWFS